MRLRVPFLLTLSILLLLSEMAFSVVVSGKVIKEWESNHQGIQIHFNAVSHSAVSQSSVTASDGSYHMNLKLGVYEMIIQRKGYSEVNHGEILIDADRTFKNDTIFELNRVKFLNDTIKGNLQNKYVYIVEHSIVVAEGDSLKIEKGTEIRFNLDAQMQVNGFIDARGTSAQRIKFVVNRNQKGAWKGLIFETLDKITLDYIYLDHAINGIKSGDSYGFALKNSVLKNVGYGYRSSSIDSQDSVQNCIVIGNPYNGGMKFWHEGISATFIENNVVHDMWAGIGGEPWSIIRSNYIYNCDYGIYDPSTEISYNVVFDCKYGMWLRSGKIINNTVYSCGSGVTFGPFKEYEFSMNVVYGNGQDIYFNDDKILKFEYNLIEGNSFQGYPPPITGIGPEIIYNRNNHLTDAYYNLYSYAPEFYSTDPADPYFLHIKSNSPCRNAGDSLLSDPDGSIRDIGAYPYVYIPPPPPDTNKASNNGSSARKMQVYPNPLTSASNIQVDKTLDWSRMQILDAHGREVYTEQNSGQEVILINRESFPSNGIYIINFYNSDGSVKTDKMLVQ